MIGPLSAVTVGIRQNSQHELDMQWPRSALAIEIPPDYITDGT